MLEAFAARQTRGFVICLVMLPMILVPSVMEKRVETVFTSMHKFGCMLLVSLLDALEIESVLAPGCDAVRKCIRCGMCPSLVDYL